jgi:hypothetical protein
MKKVLLTTVLSLMMCIGVFAQDYLGEPSPNEKIIGVVTVEKALRQGFTSEGYQTKCRKSDWYVGLLEKAKRDFPGRVIDIRKMEVGSFVNSNQNGDWYNGPAVGKVVEIGKGSPKSQTSENLSKAMDKALRNVREGSRIAIDMVTVSGGVSINREDLKDQIIDALLDKGYKVVAKDYLEKLFEEQKGWESGIYNESTTGKDNNFSAVGYYINVKVTETSLRVQVVNVSTGEYEGNATVNF